MWVKVGTRLISSIHSLVSVFLREHFFLDRRIGWFEGSEGCHSYGKFTRRIRNTFPYTISAQLQPARSVQFKYRYLKSMLGQFMMNNGAITALTSARGHDEGALPSFSPMPWWVSLHSISEVSNAVSRSMREIRAVIPPHLFLRHTTTGIFYLTRDILMAMAAWLLATYIDLIFKSDSVNLILTPHGAEFFRWCSWLT